MITPNQILEETRYRRSMTLDDMADVLGVSTQRVSQWKNGDRVPLDRIRAWACDNKMPAWAREMSYRMWLCTIELDFKAQIAELQATLSSLVLE